ncbi:metal ABC transporter permease [Corynebacterium uberis]|uniref:metal ABC transporter permease n=1 Tax=Corynebacterium TaxID=1716 RepID=UPI001D0A21FA|nr:MULTISPECIES: metal ABC transporter permease [Corynebacterium]MCZ9308865.1 metal ABC transporter permease [Corynebacterium sp. c6VSa_13]UDL74656.1 metal ABC transporter permease [Corynebacterium uberis]UDL76510.1 metal ABC transporter permease [Corynebacterium uberis]UDL78722.1 metal ABC transporter permease [Corynebacterium uberis]UDL81001.1 metal ABC transporter permease [Corynebacterium uberis]
MWTWLTEPLSYSFIPRALAVGAVTSIIAGVLSCWLILIGWSLLGDAVSHAVLPGVVISYMFGMPYAVGALVAALVAVGLVGTVKERTTLKSDTSIGVVFTALFALGLVLVSRTPASTNLQEILFGNLLGVTQASLIQVFSFGLIALALMLFFRRDITLWAFDAGHARAVGIHTTALRWVVMVCLALVVVASMQAVGVILVVAMLITPGAIAYLLTRKMNRMLLISPAIAFVCSAVGIWASFWLNVSAGGMIILVQALVFLVVYLFAPREGLITTALRERA